METLRLVTWPKELFAWSFLFLLSGAFLLVGCERPEQTGGRLSAGEARTQKRYAGFSVFGPDWPVEETFAI